MNSYCHFCHETHRLEGYQPALVVLLSTSEESWDVENPLVLNKRLLNSQGTETKTSSIQVCLEDTELFESVLRYALRY